MKEPKKIVYSYDYNQAPTTREDVEGTVPIPDIGTIIIHNGKRWRVLLVETRTQEGMMPEYRVSLSSMLHVRSAA